MRSAFIRGHAYAMSKAISEGIPVRGYFHWSLTDNFEWTQGFTPRFGLFPLSDVFDPACPKGGLRSNFGPPDVNAAALVLGRAVAVATSRRELWLVRPSWQRSLEP